MSLKRKDLLSLASLSAEEIKLILETADSFKEVTGREIKKVPALRGRTVVNLFFEPSTRTRTSFELAAKRLSADVINFSPSSSSVVKGETLLDTARNIEAMQADIIVLRHSSAGAAETLADLTGGRWDDFDHIPRVGRSISALVDTITVLLVFLVGRKLFGRQVGLLSATIYAITPLAIQLSHFYTTDIWLACFVTLTILSARASPQRNRPSRRSRISTHVLNKSDRAFRS